MKLPNIRHLRVFPKKYVKCFVLVHGKFFSGCQDNSIQEIDMATGENENKTVLDAFFLGKALAKTLNERIESTVGEILSTIVRLQAEQQKQVEDFQA